MSVPVDSTGNSSSALSTAAKKQEEAFDVLTQDIHRTEVEGRNLLHDVKNVMDAVMDLQKCEKKTVSNLKKSPLCSVGKGADDALRTTVSAWWDFLDANDKTCKASISDCTALCLDPLKEYLHVVAAHHAGLRKREQALQEHAKAEVRWRKVQKEGKFSVTTTKLNELRIHLAETELAVETLNSVVENDLKNLYQKSPQFFQPLFLILAQMQAKQCVTNYKALNSLSASRSGLSERSLQDEMSLLQSELNSLSIVDKPLS